MRRMVPDPDTMRAYLDRGLTHTQIVEVWAAESGKRVHRTTITTAIGRYGLGGRRPRYRDVIPWPRISERHNQHWHVRMLRLEARRRAGGSLTGEQRGDLESWKRGLAAAGAVIAYRYDSPDGFYAVHREDGDGELIERLMITEGK